MQYLLLFLISLPAFFAANISGGGASLIILPVLIGMGLSPIDAIGTSMLGAVGFVIGSSISPKARGIVRRDHVIPLILVVSVASLIGPLISVHLSQGTVKTLSGLMITLTAVVSLLTWNLASRSREVSKASRFLGYGLYFFSSTLLAGFGSGVGLLSNYILVGFVGMSAIETIATRRIAGLVGVPIQLSVYAFHGHVIVSYGLVLAVSGLIGSYLGINYAVKKGNNFVKKAMAVVALLLVLLIFIER